MRHFLYILCCADASYYVGITADLDLRLEYHYNGRGGAYTSRRLPVGLVYQEAHESASSARARERQIKRWGHTKKHALVAGDIALLKANAKNKQTRRRS